MKLQESSYQKLAAVTFIPTVIWYIALFFTGTNSPLETLIAVVGITVLFSLSALLFGLGNMPKTSIVAFLLAATSILIMFLVNGFIESMQWAT